MKKSTVFLAILGILLIFAVIWRVWPSAREPIGLIPHGYYSKNLYDHAYTKAGAVEASGARTAIVAHHLLVADTVAEVFQGMTSDEVETVILLSPNHFSVGREAAQVGAVGFTTPYGGVYPDVEMIQELLRGYVPLSLEDEVFQGEHGISTLTPFIKRSFPNARIVPIVLHESMPPEEAVYFGKVLARAAGPNVRVIASIDMSHNLPLDYQRFHDEVTLGVIEGGIRHAEGLDLEIDANAVLRTVLSMNAELGEEKWTLTHHNSSLAMWKTEDPVENTSHILGYFTEGRASSAGLWSALVTDDTFLHEQFLTQPFYERDRRAFGMHELFTREGFRESGVDCNNDHPSDPTVGLVIRGTECILQVIK